MAWKCPHCKVPNPEMWQRLLTVTNADGKALTEPNNRISVVLPEQEMIGGNLSHKAESASLFWTKCRNVDCSKIVVVVRFGTHFDWDRSPQLDQEWFAIPERRPMRPIDALIPEPFRRDYIEASRILADSARMSAVLSRRILADLLRTYAKLNNHVLAHAIDAFIEDTSHPRRIRENLHYLREIAGFCAHTQRDKETEEIIDASPEEAAWTLDVIDGLFEYFIVDPAKNLERQVGFEAKMKDAGRSDFKKLPEDKNNHGEGRK